jgi:GDP-L-fucose synthase
MKKYTNEFGANVNQEKILITGASGQLGSELKILFPYAIHVNSSDFDLRNENDVKRMFLEHNPKTVIHLAARVGGIKDNIKYPALYFDDNILMNTLLLKHAQLNKVVRFIAVLSSCIFPDMVERYPLVESDIHDGPPAPTNFFYAHAKRSMAIQIDAYNRQYGTKYNYVIPCNLYGRSSEENPNKSHFPLALLTKIKKALENGDDHITLFGDGTPMRQLMHSKDLANILKIMIDREIFENLNVAPNENLTINEIAELGLKVAGGEHLKVVYDTSQPTGQHRKDISNKKLMSLIQEYNFVRLIDGLHEVYNKL